MSVTTVAETTDLAERRAKYHDADVVVVGAGVFGCAVAYALAEQGRSVILLERWLKEPNRIVGELLQPGGLNSLKKLGLGDTVEGIDAVPVYGYDVVWNGKDVKIPYPDMEYAIDGTPRVAAKNKGAISAAADQNKKEKDASNPPVGCCFHHGRFIMNLRRACLKHPNITVFETEAVDTIKGDHNPEILGVSTQTVNPATGKKEPDCFFGQLTIVADGYASRFRKRFVGKAPVVRSKFYALELLDCALPRPGYGHVVIDAAAPVLLYQIGTRETRALIDVPEKLPEASPAAGGVRGYMADVVLPALPASVQPSFREALARNGDRIPASMPNSWLPPTAQDAHPGLVVLGDAMNMRHPLTGGGMTVALNDVVLLADLLAPERVPQLGDTAAVRRAMGEFHARRKRLTAIINVLAQALYSLFAARGEATDLAKLRRGCWGYFERGVTGEPVALMAGLLPRPAVLAYHFFSVAFLAIWLDWRATGLWPWLWPLLLWNAVSVLSTACVVFVPVMYREACF
ncbi:Squalene epoxidase [Diatrype stigma]|uniref:Squalene monooxygenase n=1 Tax=Diatrype stigma TaxID=117547 RepID=A0AAN9UEW7_9PEZI